MKKVNFKKLTNQFLAGVFGLALMGGVMLHAQVVEAQSDTTCSSGDDTVCFMRLDTKTGEKHRVFGGKGSSNPQITQLQ